MTRDEIQRLYTMHVIPKSRNPDNYREELTGELIDAYNPLCGDKYKIEIAIEDGVIDHIYFMGHGCALSKASAAIMSDYLTGMSPAEAKAGIERFLEQLGKGVEDSSIPEALKVLISLREFEGRMDCITLAWKALDNQDWND